MTGERTLVVDGTSCTGRENIGIRCGDTRLADPVPGARCWRRNSVRLVLVLVLVLVVCACRRSAPGDGDDGKSDAGPGATTELARQGERAFLMRCGACHAADRAQLAPSVREIASQYANDPEGIVRWAREPGRKRPEYPAMPSFRHLSEADLRAIAEHMLRAGAR